MKRLFSTITVIIMVLLLLSFGGCEEEIEQNPIKVMTFNIKMYFTPTEWYDREIEQIDFIKSYDCDIMGFQEVKKLQYKSLEENLTDYTLYGVDREGGEEQEAVVVAYRKSRFDLLDKKTIWLSETPDKISKGWDAMFNRTATIVNLKDKKINKTITIIASHFDNLGSNARLNSANLILDYVNTYDNGVVFMGDLNFSEGAEPYEVLTSKELKDTKYLAPADKSDNGGTFNMFGKVAEKPIDYIMITNEYFNVNSYSIIRGKDEDGDTYSDHFPIISVIDYK